MPTTLTIIHGDNTTKSRESLHQASTKARAAGREIIRLSAKNLSRADLESALMSTSLFAGERLLIIEGLLSLPPSQKKKTLLELLNGPLQHSLILWEPKPLTPATLKKFPRSTVISCKATKILFTWLDKLGNQRAASELHRDLPTLLTDESPQFVLSMIQRQIRLLIAADGGVVAGPPFVVQKIRQQAKTLRLPQLLAAHAALIELEFRQKQGLSRLNWHEELDLWLLSL